MRRSILFYDSSYPPPIIGGKERQAHLLALSLIQNGFTVYALTLNKGFLPQVCKYEGIRRISVPIFLLPVALVLMRVFSNIFHCHTPSRVGIVITILASLIGFNTVFKVPNSGIFDEIGLMKLLLLLSSKNIVCLEKDSLRKLCSIVSENKLLRSRISLLSNMVPLRPMSTPEEDGYFKIAFVSRLVLQKNCHQLLDIAQYLQCRRLRFKIYVIGDGPLRSTLEERSRHLGLESKFDFCGFLQDPINKLSECNILVSLSSKEGMSNTILDAMSLGIPVVCSDVGSSRYQVGKLSSSLVFPYGDVSCMLDIVYRLSYDRGFYSSSSSYLYSRSRDIFSPQKVVADYIRLYNIS